MNYIVLIQFCSLMMDFSRKQLKGWFSLAHKHKHKHNISITSENTRDISINIHVSTSRRTNPLISLILFSLAHKLKHKKNKRVCFSCAYGCLIICLFANENSIRQISGFVLVLLLMLTVKAGSH